MRAAPVDQVSRRLEPTLVRGEENRSLNPTQPVHNQGQVKTDFEAVWVAGAKAGFVGCFEELVRRNQIKIFRIAVRITRNEQDAEDAMQETFLKAHRHLGEFRGDSRFSTWLVRIAVNESLGKLRQRRKDQIAIDEPIATDDGFVPHEVEDWGPTPEQRYAQTELRQIVFQAMGNLDPAYRVVFVLRDIEQHDTAETAHLLGLSIPAVKSRLLRARLMMRENLNLYFRAGVPAHPPASVKVRSRLDPAGVREQVAPTA